MSGADIVFLLLFLLPFLFMLALIGGGAALIWFLLRRRVNNVSQRLGALASVVNGTLESGSVLPRARLTGTHDGIPIEARLMMNRQSMDREPGESALIYTSADDFGSGGYLYELSTSRGGGGEDWVAVRGVTGESYWRYETPGGYTPMGSHPQDGVVDAAWHIKSENEALAQRLLDSGAATTLQKLPDYPSKVDYTAGRLRYRSRLDSLNAAPDPERFEAQLDAFADLVEINRKVNPG